MAMRSNFVKSMIFPFSSFAANADAGPTLSFALTACPTIANILGKHTEISIRKSTLSVRSNPSVSIKEGLLRKK
jgi:hypothetical protein